MKTYVKHIYYNYVNVRDVRAYWQIGVSALMN